MLLTVHTCDGCGKVSLEPLRPNHMKPGALECCGGEVRVRRFAEVGATVRAPGRAKAAT